MKEENEDVVVEIISDVAESDDDFGVKPKNVAKAVDHAKMHVLVAVKELLNAAHYAGVDEDDFSKIVTMYNESFVRACFAIDSCLSGRH